MFLLALFCAKRLHSYVSFLGVLFVYLVFFLPIEPMPSAVKAQSPNHWTAGEFPAALDFQ